MNKKRCFILLLAIGAPIFAKSHDVEYVDIYQAMSQIQPFFDGQLTDPERANQVWRDTKELLERNVFRGGVLAEAKEVAKKARIAFVVSAIHNELDQLQADKNLVESEIARCGNDNSDKCRYLRDLSAVYGVVFRYLEREYFERIGLLSKKSAGDVEAKLLSISYWRAWVTRKVGYYAAVSRGQDIEEPEEHESKYYFESECGKSIDQLCGDAKKSCEQELRACAAELNRAYQVTSSTDSIAGEKLGDIIGQEMPTYARWKQGLVKNKSMPVYQAAYYFEDESSGDEQEKTELEEGTESDRDDKWGSYVRDTDSEAEGELPPLEDFPSHDTDSDADEPPPLEDFPEDELSEQELAGQEFGGQEPVSEEGGEWTSY